jgi:Lysylphosphatidylglycerol synthase TM region
MAAHHTSLASMLEGRLGRSALRIVGYGVLAILVLKLVPSLEQALTTLTHASWIWLVGALALELASEAGYVIAWGAVVDPEGNLARGIPGRGIDTRLAWAQLGGSTLVPAGTAGSLGIGAWILHRLGMPGRRIAERELSLCLLNTGVDAVTVCAFGLALATGLISGRSNLAFTLLPAVVAGVGLIGVLWLARHEQGRVADVRRMHPKRAASLAALVAAVVDVDEFLFHGARVRAALGTLAYFGFDVLVLWTAFFAVHAKPVPSIGVVILSYVIGALGGSIPGLGAVGSVGGRAGMLILGGVGSSVAVATVVLYQAVNLLVPVAGGTIAFLSVRGDLHSEVPDEGAGPSSG